MWFFYSFYILNFHVPSAKLSQEFISALSLVAAFAKLLKASPCFVISTYPSVRLSVYLSPFHAEQQPPTWRNFREILYLYIFRKSVDKFQLSLQSDKNNRQVLYMTTYVQLCVIISCRFMFRMRNIWDKIFRRDQNK
jgi:hypothetical protein